MKKSNIVLTGFMGVGKTRVGKRLAQLLEMDFIDTGKTKDRIKILIKGCVMYGSESTHSLPCRQLPLLERR
jgi:cytidylate kinase